MNQATWVLCELPAPVSLKAAHFQVYEQRPNMGRGRRLDAKARAVTRKEVALRKRITIRRVRRKELDYDAISYVPFVAAKRRVEERRTRDCGGALARTVPLRALVVNRHLSAGQPSSANRSS